MSKRTAFWLAWFTWVLYVIIAIITLLLQFKDDPSSWLNDMFDALILLAFATVGSLVASRRPENPIGWLFCISTLLWALGSLLQEYTTYVLIDQLGGDIPLLLFPTVIACIVAVFLRYRQARGMERQQLKWFTYGLAISILMLL